MQIILQSLNLSNFKGIRDLKIEFSKDTKIYGDNGTGKTTIFDAFTWLLFDKDSLNRSDFGIKTYTKDGDTVHGVDHIVEGVLEINGKIVTLKKIYAEKWVKKRGNTTAEFTGHTTEYYVNSVPMKKTDYVKTIDGFVTEEQFKLLSNPNYFNAILNPKERRTLIMRLVSDVDNETVIANNSELKELKELLENYTIEEIRAMHKGIMKKTNKEIQELPVRIDELNKQIVEYDFNDLRTQKIGIESTIKKLNGEVLSVEEKEFERKEKEQEIDKKRNLILSIKRKNQEEYEEKVYQQELEKKELQHKYEILLRELKAIENNRDFVSDEISIYELQQDTLRKEWAEIKARQFVGDTICPTCKQEFPSKNIEEMKANFNEEKSKDIEVNVTEGKRLATLINNGKESIEKLTNKIIELNKEIENFENKLKEPKLEIVKEPLPDKYYELIKSVEELENIQPLKVENSELKKELQEYKDKLKEIDNKLAAEERNQNLLSQINKYSEDEKELANTYQESEGIIYLTDEFTKTKVNLISGNVNKLFDLVEFKLFDTQINGGINETCEVTINGVPYSDLNSASKINAGIDVINALSNKYGISTPIFVDNAESINDVEESNAQMIKLVVSKDNILKIER